LHLDDRPHLKALATEVLAASKPLQHRLAYFPPRLLIKQSVVHPDSLAKIDERDYGSVDDRLPELFH
jgi:hypothetical protein